MRVALALLTAIGALVAAAGIWIASSGDHGTGELVFVAGSLVAAGSLYVEGALHV